MNPRKPPVSPAKPAPVLQASEEQLRLLVAGIRDYAIFMLDPEGRVVTWNAGAERIKGYRAEEVIGRHFSIFYPAEDMNRGVPEQLLKKARAEGRIERTGWRVRKDGSRFWANVIITALYDDRGELAGFVKVTRDVTRQRQAEEALRESRQMFEGLFEEAPDALVVVSPDGAIRRVNRETEELFGFEREDLLGRQVEALIPERFRDRHRRHRQAYFEDPRRRRMGSGLELFARHRDGREIPVDIMLSPLGSGEDIWVLAVVRDITEQKRNLDRIRTLNRDLEEKIAQLENLNQELEAFSYSASHDLRTPLRAMNGFSQALLEDYGEDLDEEGRDYLERIRQGARKMDQLIDHLLTLSRLSRAKMRLEEVDLSAMAETLRQEFTSSDPRRQVEWVVEPGLTARGDPDLLLHLLQNLLGNAWKFTSRTRDARIEFTRDPEAGEDGCFVVRDNGAGFNPDFADKLFLPFERLHSPKEFPGSGVGLAIVQRVIRRHGGWIRAEGREGAGAVFHFCLPVRDGTSDPGSTPSSNLAEE